MPTVPPETQNSYLNILIQIGMIIFCGRFISFVMSYCVVGCIVLEVSKDCNTVKMSGTIHVMTQCHIQEELDVEEHCCEDNVGTYHISETALSTQRQNQPTNQRSNCLFRHSCVNRIAGLSLTITRTALMLTISRRS
jgi:hypothetical protein